MQVMLAGRASEGSINAWFVQTRVQYLSRSVLAQLESEDTVTQPGVK